MVNKTHALLTAVSRDGCLDTHAVGDVQELLHDPVFARLPRAHGNPLQSYLYVLRQAIVALDQLSQGRVEEAVKLSACALRGVRVQLRSECPCANAESDLIEDLPAALEAMCVVLMQRRESGDAGSVSLGLSATWHTNSD